jgi:hypothetical protein
MTHTRKTRQHGRKGAKCRSSLEKIWKGGKCPSLEKIDKPHMKSRPEGILYAYIGFEERSSDVSTSEGTVVPISLELQ